MFCEINIIFTSFPVLPGVFVRIPPNKKNLCCTERPPQIHLIDLIYLIYQM